MLTNRIAGIYRLHLLLQGLGVTAVFGCIYLVLVFFSYQSQEAPYLQYWVVSIISLIIEGTVRNREAHGQLVPSPKTTRKSTIRQVAAMAFGMSLFLTVTKDANVSRIFVLSFLGFSFLFLSASNQQILHLISKLAFRNRRNDRTVLIGSAEKLVAHAKEIADLERYGIEIVAILSPDNPEQLDERSRELYRGGLEEFHSVVDRQSTEQVILLELFDDIQTVREFVRLCESRSVRFLLLNNVFERMGTRAARRTTSGFDVMFLHDEPLEDPLNRFLKRAADIVISGMVMLTVFPVCCVVVKLIHLFQSRGPLFFVQRRMGMEGEPFNIIKFRSLHHNVEHDEATQVSEVDPRVFSGGRFIRKSSIDEIPQFLNVFLGEMSSIGPRPHLVEHDEIFSGFMENYHTRARVKPGITGLAQVRGHRGQTDGNPDKIRLRVLSDIAYLESWSLELDASILLKTMIQVVRPPKSAY